jgi:hypothetical protein
MRLRKEKKRKARKWNEKGFRKCECGVIIMDTDGGSGKLSKKYYENFSQKCYAH